MALKPQQRTFRYWLQQLHLWIGLIMLLPLVMMGVTGAVLVYAHDIEIGKGASQWVVNARAMVRPTITYGLFFLLVFVDMFGFYYAISTGIDFAVAMDQLWDNDTQTIWASVVSFWFGTQAFSKK